MRDKGDEVERASVWAVGGNSRGQLGLGYASPSSPVPGMVAFQLAPHEWVVEVFCGYEHTFALTSDGNVLGFGNGFKGQLGIGNTDSHSSPQRVHLLCGQSVVKMAAGLEHSLALTESGDLYSFGDNLSGQLGLGHNYTAKEQTPQKVPSLSKAKVTQMACGQDHTAVITSSGELFTFGNNRFGALGLPGHAEDGPPIVASTPQLVTTLGGKCVVQIGCGLQHTVALTGAGQVFTWGHNSRGQLGTGDTQNRFTPSLVCKPLSAARCIHVACGGQHTLAVTEHDDVFGFGSDRHGQLGLGQGGVVFPVPSRIVRLGGRRVQHCVGGAWHTVIRTDTGENYMMGCILPAADGVEEANPTNTPDLRRRSNRATATGAATPSDPFSLSFGGFRRLMLPRGAEACSKGHSLFYGQGLGAPPPALRKVVKSLVRLKADLSRMLVRQKPNVVFTGDAALTGTMIASGSSRAGADGSATAAGAHLAVLRARCPILYKHAADAIRRGAGGGPRDMDDADGRPVAWRVPSFPGIPIDALQLVIAYLYQDAGVFDKHQGPDKAGLTAASDSASAYLPSPMLANKDNTSPGETSSYPTIGAAAGTPQEPDRMRERRERLWSIRARAGVANKDVGGEIVHGTKEATMNPWEDEEEDGEDEAAAGFGSFGSAYGGSGKYDGAGLDRLMAVMAAARTLGLSRLQGLCEKRAEAFIDCRTVHKVLRRAADGGFLYLERRCLEFCLTRLSEVCAPGNSSEVVRELSKHPAVLADVLSLAAASEGARQAAAREVPFDGAGKVPCIEALSGESPCAVPVEGYQQDFLRLYETVVRASVAGELHTSQPTVITPRPAIATNHPLAELSEVGRLSMIFDDDVSKGREEESAWDELHFSSVGDSDEDAGDRVSMHPVEGKGDFKICAGEGKPHVTVHRCILAARSGFFRALLEGGMGDAQQGELVLKFEPIICLEALLEFIRFLYTGRTGVMDPLTALDVLFLTKGDEGGFFQVTGNDELQTFCKSTLMYGINSANALPILVRAKALGDEEAMETAISFLLANFDACMRPHAEPKGSETVIEGGSVPACLGDDESPAVDLLLALAERCTVSVKTSNAPLEHGARVTGRR